MNSSMLTPIMFSFFVALTLCSPMFHYYVEPQQSAFTIKVTFITDYSVAYSGFVMNFYLSTYYPPCNGPALSLLGSSSTHPVVVTSPNYPYNYPNNIK